MRLVFSGEGQATKFPPGQKPTDSSEVDMAQARLGAAALTIAALLSPLLATASANAAPSERPAGPVATSAASSQSAAPRWTRKDRFDTGYHPQCRGWERHIPPYRSGGYIKSSRELHCNRGGWGRNMAIKTTLQQYRGLGYWRTKATRHANDNNATPAFTIKQDVRWKCSGGSQLYRNQTRLLVFSVLRGKQSLTFHDSDHYRRIRC
ncbi:hypothetical protein [Nonomuraea sp. B19D2]|uniref:hypothetical protein n=1 Tax=Nonomuraea sp. B19D2 TaxID=3159561 RepID=UPI0032DAA061